MKTGLLLLASAMLLSACSTAPAPALWTKIGFTHQQFEADWGECRKDKAPTECMTAKGYVQEAQ